MSPWDVLLLFCFKIPTDITIPFFFFFFFNDTATTEIYTLSLHDALPILYCMEYTFPISYSYSLETFWRSEEHTSELQSHSDLVCRLLLEKKTKLMESKSKRNITRRLCTSH